MQQIAVGRMQFHYIEARGIGAHRRRGKCRDRRRYRRVRHGLRHGMSCRGKRHRTGAHDRRPAAFVSAQRARPIRGGTRLAAGMGQLDTRGSAL